VCQKGTEMWIGVGNLAALLADERPFHSMRHATCSSVRQQLGDWIQTAIIVRGAATTDIYVAFGCSASHTIRHLLVR
jgi:hypothetical protein